MFDLLHHPPRRTILSIFRNSGHYCLCRGYTNYGIPGVWLGHNQERKFASFKKTYAQIKGAK
jgi:hypothetical protein